MFIINVIRELIFYIFNLMSFQKYFAVEWIENSLIYMTEEVTIVECLPNVIMKKCENEYSASDINPRATTED